MIIIKNHLRNEDTAIYGDIISHGAYTFHISQLNEKCDKSIDIKEIKQDILKYHQENIHRDDMSKNILNALKSENNDTLNDAVAFGTKNYELLEGMLLHFNNNLSIKGIIVNREDVANQLITELYKRALPSPKTVIRLNTLDEENERTLENIDVRSSITKPIGLNDGVIQKLLEDHFVRNEVAKQPNLNPAIIQALSKDEHYVVRGSIARRPDIDPFTIQMLSIDKHHHVRLMIALRRELDEEIVQELAEDPDSAVRQIIAERAKGIYHVAVLK